MSCFAKSSFEGLSVQLLTDDDHWARPPTGVDPDYSHTFAKSTLFDADCTRQSRILPVNNPIVI